MKVELKRKNDGFHFESFGANNTKISMDASEEIGGEGKGARPMELLLMSIGGCASIDFGLILKKQKQVLDSYDLIVAGERSDDASKSLISANLHFIIKGVLDAKKVERAIELTVNKYCSVLLSLNPEIKINTEYTIN